MSIMPRIRILWIDDRERVSGFPEMQIPLPYANWFEVSHPKSSVSSAMSYTCARDFSEQFLPFWLEGKPGQFPVEIIATDYNLKKRAAASSGGQALKPLGLTEQHVQVVESTAAAGPISSATGRPEFDGLLIGAFYAALTHRHPAVLVSITNYLGDFPSEVDTLQDLITPLLTVAQQPHSSGTHAAVHVWHNLSATERSWQNIIHAGIASLRRRIIELYTTGDLIIPCQELIGIVNSALDCTVTIKSPHASRMLPLEGLFCDVVDPIIRKGEMKKWATKLLESRITIKHHDSAFKLASTVWKEYYNNDVLINDHFEFSESHASGGSAIGARYAALSSQFKPELKGTRTGTRLVCTQHCGDIRMGSDKEYSNAARRWAAIFLIRWLLKRVLLFIAGTNIKACTRRGTVTDDSPYPTFEEDDILLLLFPVPESPFPLPCHCNDSHERDNLKGGWRSAMKTKLGFEPSEILDGSALTRGERQVLQGMAIYEDTELGNSPDERLSAWKAYEPARLFLFGSDGPQSEGQR